MIFDPRWVQSLGWALIHFLWQGAVVGCLAWVALRVAGKAAPGIRHGLALVALLVCLWLPVHGTWSGLRTTAALPRQGPQAMFVLQETPELQMPRPQAVSWRQRVELGLRPWLPWIVGAWALGCLGLGLRWAGGVFWLRRLRRRAEPVDPATEGAFQELVRRFGVVRPVDLRRVAWGSTPVTFGFWRPVVLMPAACLAQLPPDYLEALLAHELAHVVRWDHLSLRLEQLLTTVLFFHPCVWWLCRELRATRELLADTRAARVLGDSRRLAHALNALDDLLPPTPLPALAARDDEGHLMHRIAHLLSLNAPTKQLSRPWVLPTALSLVLGLAVAGGLWAQEPVPEVVDVAPDLLQSLDRLAEREKVDLHLLRAMAYVESRYDPDARSPRGAMGLLQVMPATAQRFGAQDLTSREQVLEAGVKYLRFLMDRYPGDPAKAVAAYNAGEEALDANRLTPETPAYVAKVMALHRTQGVRPAQDDRARGILSRNAEGTWKVSLSVAYQGSLDVVVDAGGSTLAEVRVGQAGDPTAAPRRMAYPVVVFGSPEKGPLRVMLRDRGGRRKAETLVLRAVGGGVLAEPLAFNLAFQPE